MELAEENVKEQKGVKSYITLRQSTFHGAGIKWKALEGGAGAGSDRDGHMSQSLGKIRTESIHWEGNVNAPHKEHGPHTVDGGAPWGGQVAVPAGAATGVKWASTGTVWTEGAFARGIQGCPTDHIPSPPHIFKVIS